MTEAKTQVMEVTGNQGIRLLAIDLGASSGRVMLGCYRDGKVTVEEIHRFPNGPVEVNGHLHWDVQRLLEEIKQGIAAAAASYGPLHSLSVDTWGVDYGLLDEQGGLLDAPHHYRNQRMADIASALEAALPPAEQFKLTGNQSSPINTVYQLFADLMAKPELRTTARQLLMMPDLFHYMLSGVAVAEQTIWSTSGLLNPQSTAPAAEVLRRLELPVTLVPRLVPAGTVLGSSGPRSRKSWAAVRLRSSPEPRMIRLRPWRPFLTAASALATLSPAMPILVALILALAIQTGSTDSAIRCHPLHSSAAEPGRWSAWRQRSPY